MRTAVSLDLQDTLGGQGLDDALVFTFFPFAPRAIRLINQAGLLAIVVTNQSHIAKGCFTMAEFQVRMACLEAELREGGAHLDDVLCCPHGGDDLCDCRKPKSGLIRRAQARWGIDIGSSYVVGDVGPWDMRLAKTVGAKAVLVHTSLGESSLGEYRHTWAEIEADFVAADVLEAAQWVAREHARAHGKEA